VSDRPDPMEAIREARSLGWSAGITVTAAELRDPRGFIGVRSLLHEAVRKFDEAIEAEFWARFEADLRRDEEEAQLRREAPAKYAAISDDFIARMERLRAAGRWSPQLADRMLAEAKVALAAVPNPPKRDPLKEVLDNAR
jgi:hypothetical protein